MTSSLSNRLPEQAGVSPASTERHAFGLQLSGLRTTELWDGPAAEPLHGAACQVHAPRGSREEEMAAADRPGALLMRRFPDGRAATVLHRLPDGAHEFYGAGYGTMIISPDLARVDCYPESRTHLRWQRFLVAQALPLVTLLAGAEVLHAGAVAIGDHVVAFTGTSGAGKTTLVAELVARGARFVTDDVLAIQLKDGGLLAHPGAAVLGLRHGAVSDETAEATGEAFDVDDQKRYIRPAGGGKPLPLSALYWLERAGGVTGFEVSPLTAVHMLAASFNNVIRTPERLRVQLEVGSALASGARLAHVPEEMDAGTLADLVLSREAA